MKWVKIREGHYKLVDDEDDREAIELPKKTGVPNVHIAPPWKKYEKGQSIGTPNSQSDYQDKFLAERDNAMKETKWKRWEESRKKSVARDKPAWRKTKSVS